MHAAIHRAIIVCALGYFIDIFDIQLFAVLRISSLTELGVSSDKLVTIGGNILNIQMFGMVLGAFLWGWLGDKLGRVKPLYGSILIYSLGTLACSFAQDPISYGICRFITGFGLAGETGIAVTLIAELMPLNKRSLGISLVGGFGSCGPLLAIALSWFLNWRTTYFVAGMIGLILLILRIKLVEPVLFEKVRSTQTNRGSLPLLLQPKQFLVFLGCIAIGLPTIYSVNLLNFFSLEISRAVLKPGAVFDQKLCMLLFYSGLGFGSFANNLFSQFVRSQRIAVTTCILIGATVSLVYLLVSPIVKISPCLMYGINFRGCPR